jgi:N-acylglucosamine-6-phosphate 2-epimerase
MKMPNPKPKKDAKIKSSLERLKDGLIVSCQAPEASPLNRIEILVAFALTAEQNGAAGVRLNSTACIQEARKLLKIPILGLQRMHIPGSEVCTTPTIEAARRIVEAGCDLVAIDATRRPRPAGEEVAAIVKMLRKEFIVGIVADISDIEEGLIAEQLGVDAVATTMAGFTRDTRGHALPNYELVSGLARRLRIPLVCEGGISTTHQVRRAFEEGAYAVCVGRALTGLDWLVREYNAATPRMAQAPTLDPMMDCGD